MLTGTNIYTGGTVISAGTLQIGDGGTSGSIAGDVANAGVLAFDRSDAAIFAGAVSGSGSLEQRGIGTTVLTGTNVYTGSTIISAGTLQIGNGGTSGSIVGDVTNAGVLAFDRSDVITFGGLISGAGSVNQAGSGATVLTGTNTYAGATTVAAGGLFINGNQSTATALTTVNTGGTLGGIGTIGGSVVVGDGGTLSPGDTGTTPGTLTILQDLTLASGSVLDYNFGQANAVGGLLNDLTIVGGDLTLDGTLNVAVSAGGAFDPGIYRVISYGGALTDNGLVVGAIPVPDFYVQTSIANQVNLVSTQGMTLNYRDGNAGPKNNSVVDGGDGTWQASTGNDSWTGGGGAVNGPSQDAAFAIFAGTQGTVTVDNSLGAINASGMQFATDRYLIDGGAITLSGAPSSIIRVGDGTAGGAAIVATIASELTGASELVKTDLGTFVLSGANSYTGGTVISAGTLAIASDANLGAASGGLTLDGGTLHTTADIGPAVR